MLQLCTFLVIFVLQILSLLILSFFCMHQYQVGSLQISKTTRSFRYGIQTLIIVIGVALFLRIMNRFCNIYCRVISLLSQLGRLISDLLFKFSALFFKLHHSLVCLYVIPFFSFVFLVKLHYFLSSDSQFVHQNLYPLLKLVLSDHLLQSFPLVILDSLQAAHLFL